MALFLPSRARAAPVRVAPPLPLFTSGGVIRPLLVRRVANARAMRLRVDPRDGAVRLTLSPRAALGPALRWVEEQRGWIEAQLATLIPAVPFVPGAVFMLEGTNVTIAAVPGARGVVRAGDVLRIGGPVESLAPRLLRWLKAHALATLRAETLDYAAEAGVTIGRVGIGDTRSRWGSCSGNGDIRYSWRLILAPPEVRRATVAHEVAHRLHMDHSPAFHAAATRLFGRDPVPERLWLRAHGAALHAIGRALEPDDLTPLRSS